MNTLLPTSSLLATFLLASLLLAVTPGPCVFYIVTRTLAQGRQAGFASVVGVALGNAGNSIATALGLAALFAISTLVFTIVKYAGAAYLIYLGLKTFRTPTADITIGRLEKTPPSKIFRDGFIVALLNPKTAIFFAAFLPQFIQPTAASPFLQNCVLGMIFVMIGATTDTAYVLIASAAAPLLTQLHSTRTLGRYITASALIGLGFFTAITAKPHSTR